EFAVRTEKVDRAHVQFARVLEEARLNFSDKSLWVRSLRNVLGDHTLGNGSNDARDAICVNGDLACTVSFTIIFLDQTKQRFYSFNSPAPPSRTSFNEAFLLQIVWVDNIKRNRQRPLFCSAVLRRMDLKYF